MHFRDIFFFVRQDFSSFNKMRHNHPKHCKTQQFQELSWTKKCVSRDSETGYTHIRKTKKTDSNFSHTRYNEKPAIKMRSNCFSEWCKYIPPLSIYMLAHLLKFVKSFFEFLFKLSINIETLSRVAEYLSWHPEVLHRCYIIIYYEKNRKSIEKRGDLW